MAYLGDNTRYPHVLVFLPTSSYFCAGQRLTPHNRTLEVRPGRITKKLELKYDYDCETKGMIMILTYRYGRLRGYSHIYRPDRSALQRQLAIGPTGRLSNANWL